VDRNQLKTILWLRWRLTRNQWKRSGGLGEALAVVIGIGICLLSAAGLFGGFLVGFFALGKARPDIVMVVWFGLTAAFCFVWTIGLINELQRSETIDLQRLMHLPVALGQIFGINYLTSHLTLSTFLFVPAMMGLGLGLGVARSPLMLLLLPLAVSMVLMISAWTYYLRGWLAALMTNPRRRRTIIMGLTLAFILVAQAPNIYFNLLRRHSRPNPDPPTETQPSAAAKKEEDLEKLKQLVAIQKYIPPLWVPLGARSLAEGRVLPALLGTVGCLGIATIGLRRAYRSTMQLYFGEIDADKTGTGELAPLSPAPAPVTKPVGRSFLERRLPGVPEPAAALALATLRSMLRAPEVKMAWGTSFVVTLIVGGSVLFRSPTKIPDGLKPFFATGALVFSVFLLIQFLANQFGFDRDGFRALVLSPVERRLILLGKNLACLPVALVFGFLMLAVVSIWLHLSVVTFAAALLQLVGLLLLAGLVGNLVSILVPYRIQPGTMKPTKMPALATLAMVLCHLLFPVTMTPLFLPAAAELVWQRLGGAGLVPINLLCSLVVAGLAALLYWQTLGPLGNLLRRREAKILSVVTVETE